MLTQWTNFAITIAGAAAALAGLMVVAMSVNIMKILDYRHLPMRAAATIAGLLLVLIIGIAALIPERESSFGLLVLFFAVACWLLQLSAARQTMLFNRERQRPLREAVRGIVFGQLQTLPCMIGAALLVLSNSVGMYWLAAGSIVIFVLAMFNVWVLLVEILR